MAGFMGRLKKLGKQVDDKTKDARVTGAVLLHTVAPVAGPVSQAYVAPPETLTQYSQQVVRDEQGQYKDWSQLQAERENAQLGTRAPGTPHAQPAGRLHPAARSGHTGQTANSPGKSGHEAGNGKTGQPGARSQPAPARGQAPPPNRSSSHGGSAGHSSGRPAGR